jgi:hypothetical protein
VRPSVASMSTIRIRLGHESLDVTLAYYLQRIVM